MSVEVSCLAYNVSRLLSWRMHLVQSQVPQVQQAKVR